MRNLKEWFSANELKGLEGLPNSPQGINKRARTQKWIKRERDGVQGGALEYHYSSLPLDVQKQLGFNTEESFKGIYIPGVIQPASIVTERALRDFKNKLSKATSKDKVLQALQIIEEEIKNLNSDNSAQFKLNDEELHLIENFRLCNKDRRMILIASAETLANQTQKEQKESSEPLTDRKIA